MRLGKIDMAPTDIAASTPATEPFGGCGVCVSTTSCIVAERRRLRTTCERGVSLLVAEVIREAEEEVPGEENGAVKESGKRG